MLRSSSRCNALRCVESIPSDASFGRKRSIGIKKRWWRRFELYGCRTKMLYIRNLALLRFFFAIADRVRPCRSMILLYVKRTCKNCKTSPLETKQNKTCKTPQKTGQKVKSTRPNLCSQPFSSKKSFSHPVLYTQANPKISQQTIFLLCSQQHVCLREAWNLSTLRSLGI